jgi:phage-related minor tail protein
MFATTDGFAVAGEAGAEAILPLSRGSNGELGVNAQGMGAVNVNFTINAVDAQGIDQLLIEKKQFITNMVRSAVADRGKIGNFF